MAISRQTRIVFAVELVRHQVALARADSVRAAQTQAKVGERVGER